MSKKLYVGNLSYQTSNESLTTLFSQFGEVASAQVITDRDSGRSKGFAFVEMTSDEGAREAVSNLDGTEYDGRNIKVNVAKPKESRNDRGGERGGFRRNSRY